ncbi:hypothetical protein P154DRAFT_582599 [Amniculicola lignicola CBS 123094]|uniref:Developmental regulatory protein wetA n=1 Tax=Amniculicola lignicola CBS 123094 TaxID=1392246 RepID=A0A6A5W7L6_9PLEO|nr:hypothetical protein P154DRAFT_582599 [Amniculicola lignicola CBS 123094]
MRPTTDKEIEVFDLDDLFDQYVETDLLQQFSDNTAEPSGLDHLAHLFELPSSNTSEPIETSLMPNWDTSDEDAWHKALENLRQNPASPIKQSNSLSIYPESRGKASFSDPELFCIDDLFEFDNTELRLTISTPPTPTPLIARPARKSASNIDWPTRSGVHKTTKKPTVVSKMMRPSQYRPGFQDIWARKLEGPADNFNLQLPHTNLPTTPPPSTKFLHEESSNAFFPRDQPYTSAVSPLPGDDSRQDMSQSNYQLTPLSSPALDANSRNVTGNPYQFSDDNMANAYISHINNAALSALQTPPATTRLGMGTWGPETPGSLEYSSFSASPEFQTPNTGKSQAWWGNGDVTATQPPTASFHRNVASRSSSQSMAFSAASGAGLGISCDTASFSNFSPELDSVNSHETSNSFSASSFDVSSFSTSHLSSAMSNGIPIAHQSPPSRSPSSSPLPHFTRQRRQSSHPYRAHRRKSSNSTSTSTSHSQSRTHSNGSGVGFVNFTPDDSKKILTGVAPSGSSKTKARREKEAQEKRRKLSQAAVRAVVEAGGDLDRLKEEGLLYVGE